jgi:dienelactone hydrolase
MGRRLWLKCWYPAEPGGGRPELLWAQLRAEPSVPLPWRALLGCVRWSTSTYARAPFSSAAARSRVVVYNHGLISMASENTSLVEELASHGFTVISIQHVEQLLELRALAGGESQEKKRSDAKLAAALRHASPTDRAKLAPAVYRASTNTNRIVVERARDTAFVLDNVDSVLEQIPGASNRIDADSVQLVGFSVGGAVATEAARADGRAASVVNIDGGMQGTLGSEALRVPYLMMYSAANEGMNDALLPPGAQRLVGADTAHLNHHDAAALVPGLRLFGAIGKTAPKAFLTQRNRAVVAFCQAHAP